VAAFGGNSQFLFAPAMATKVNHKAAIRATFQARPDLKEVHILPSGEHFFNKDHATQALEEDGELVTLAPDADELKPTAKDKTPTSPTA
jgi:hypothetical protein